MRHQGAGSGAARGSGPTARMLVIDAMGDAGLLGTVSLDGSTHARGVAVDAAGNIVSVHRKDVQVFSPDGTLLHARLGGLEMAHTSAMGGVAIDPSSGRIAVGDKEAGIVHLL